MVENRMQVIERTSVFLSEANWEPLKYFDHRRCASYLLLHNKFSPNVVAQRTPNTYYLSQFLWVKNSGASWADSHWVSHKVAVRCWLRFQSSEDVVGSRGSNSKLPYSHDCQVGSSWWCKTSGPLHVAFTMTLLECSHDMVQLFPGWEIQKGGSVIVLYDVASEVTHHCFCSILWVTRFIPDSVREETT